MNNLHVKTGDNVMAVSYTHLDVYKRQALRGCKRRTTVEWNETGARTMFAPAGQTTARACLLANCRRSLRADKRPARGLPVNDRLPYSCGPHMCGPYKAMTFHAAICLKNRTSFPKNHALC